MAVGLDKGRRRPSGGEVPSTRVSDRNLELLLTTIPDDPDSFKRLCAEVTDWSALLARAGRHGVAGLLYQPLVESACDLPLAVRKDAARQRAIEQIWQSRAQAQLGEALRALGAASVRSVSLKGPVLAERVYPDPSVRLSVDLDLLVVPDDLDRAISALETIGYVAEEGPSARYVRKHHHHICLYPRLGPPIELHFRSYAGFGIVIPAEEFMTRACPYRTCLGPVTWVLSPEDEVLYLAVHAAGHCVERLLWLYDLKLLLRSYADLDWSAVVARARSLKVVTALSFTCELLRQRLGVAIPEDGGLAPLPVLRSRAASMLRLATMARPGPAALSTLAWLAHMAVLCDRPASATWLLQHHLLRIARRRAQRYFPGVVPEEWSA